MTSVRSAASTALPPIRAAVARSKREAIRRELENCQLLAGIWCHGLTVRQLQALRGALPDTARLVVAKNSLVEKAIEGTKWEPLRPCAKGMNAWLFVHSDDVPPALNPYRHFQREWKLALNDFTGAVYEGRLYGPDDFAALEAMPTRLQSYAYLLGCLHTPAVSLLGVLQAAPVQPAPAPPPPPPPKEES
ncbi:50S ribosomal protein L10, chloroplastic-like [Ananas comosus]|uniref:Large ribosomal subunit protein uL10c n=1 Tax=Ananas comosus TaxID=4615 RepID=A0A6P5GJ19_ANACO|nr:50S ribosomal protein L10, chloroplastic-like [Ananas comosus]